VSWWRWKFASPGSKRLQRNTGFACEKPPISDFGIALPAAAVSAWASSAEWKMKRSPPREPALSGGT
jgi:hypothetical protein